MLSKIARTAAKQARATLNASRRATPAAQQCYGTLGFHERTDATPLFDNIGALRFDDAKMQEALEPSVYANFKQSLETGESLSKDDANAVAQALMNWAIKLGCTQYAHWYMPMRCHDGRAASALKLDGFVDLDYGSPDSLKPIEGKKFSGGQLFQNETDGSSYPNGGLRATHTAAAFVSWDKSSAPFIRDNTLYLPSGFMTHYGHSLDHKTPLMRSNEAINKQGTRLLKLLGDEQSTEVVSNVGCEQEYFLIDAEHYQERPDLVASGRMLFGALSDRNQENCENYFGFPHRNAKLFMTELQAELWELGVSVFCQHNEVAPSQHELAPIFSLTNVAADQNMLMMEVMDTIATRHGLKVLFHEKPFAGINGSGKHNNWGLNTNSGKNLFNPGKTEETQSDFMAFTAALMYAINNHGDVIRAGVACAGNDHRLGAQEAPPAIISLYTGVEMEKHIDSIIDGGELPGYGGEGGNVVEFGSRALQAQQVNLEDRNRTAPFPFCGNRFEFRAVGSSQNIAQPLAFLNTAVADGLDHLCGLIEGGQSPRDAVAQVMKENKRCVFNGDGYSDAWPVEAEKRGLVNNKDCVMAWKDFDSAKNQELFSKHAVFKDNEVESRKEVALGEYTQMLMTESLCAVQMADTGVLPACAKDLKNYSGDAQALAGERPSVYAKVSTETQALKGLLEAFPGDADTVAQAEYCAQTLKPKMNELREVVDMAERLCEADLWPYPKYDEIVFHHQVH
jgi:glutamine synthetase